MLQSVYRTFRQKQLLEDAILIYRITRAPERLIFKIDTSGMQPHRVQQYLEKFKDHHAILPTVGARTDLSELPSGERDVLTLLAVRLLCATTQVHRFEAVTAILDCQGYTFTAKGKTILQSGWKEVDTAKLRTTKP